MKQLLTLLICTALFSGCKKYLEAKPDAKLRLPDNLPALQGLLDNENSMNLNSPGVGEASADNYWLPDATWSALFSTAQRNMYTWEADITLQEFPNHWSGTYDVVTICNVVLENLDKIKPLPAEQAAWNNIRGSALYYRAKSFLSALGIWARAYDPATAPGDPGVPIRLSSDYNIPSVRNSVQEGYDRVLTDLREAVTLLPAEPQHVMRPSVPAAWGLLARTWLIMGNYDSAAAAAGRYLAQKNTLLNYNTLNGAATYPFPKFNAEVIMHGLINTYTQLLNSRARVDSNLFASYTPNDLRRSLFFKSNGDGTYGFRGSYNQSGLLYNGITTDELYLIKAECLARKGNLPAAMDALNTLLVTRWKTGTFVPFTAADAPTALAIILAERRKELLFRDLRWTDLKRLNRDPALQQTLRRRISGTDYILPPNDNRYAQPIPASVIALSGMQQNPR